MRLVFLAVVVSRVAIAEPIAVSDGARIEMIDGARTRTVALRGVTAMAWDADGTLWAIDGTQVWRVAAAAKVATRWATPALPADLRARQHTELRLFTAADGRAVVELCQDLGDYNDAPMCLHTVDIVAGSRAIAADELARRTSLPAPHGYAATVDVQGGWFLSCVAAGAPPRRLFGGKPAEQIFDPVWLSANPPVIGAPVVWSDGDYGWMASPACDPASAIRLGTTTERADEPVIGAHDLWAARGKDGWTVRRGLTTVATFPADRTLALSPR